MLDAATAQALQAAGVLSPDVASQFINLPGNTPPPSKGNTTAQGTVGNAETEPISPVIAQAIENQSKNPVQSDATNTTNQQPTIGPPGTGPSTTFAGLSAGSGQQPNSTFPLPGPPPNVIDVAGLTKGFTGAEQLGEAGIQKTAQAASEAANATSAYLGQKAINDETFAKTWAVTQADRQAQLEAQQQKVEQALQDYSSMNLDPKHYGKTLSMPQKIVDILAMIAGGFGAYGTGNNKAVEAYNTLVQRDIDAQRFNIQKAGNVAQSERSIYSDMLARFGDERQAMLMTKQIYDQNAATHLQQITAQYQPGVIAGNAQQAMAGLQNQLTERKLQIQQVGQGVADRQYQYQTEMAMLRWQLGNGIGGQIQLMVPKEQQSAAIKEVGDLQSANQAADLINNTQDNVAKLQTGLGGLTQEIPFTQTSRKIDAANVAIDSQLKAVLGTNRFSELTKEELNNFHVGYFDSPATIAMKKATARQILMSNVSTPTLNLYHITSPVTKPVAFQPAQ